MNDKELSEILGSLQPRQAPSGLDRAVLNAAEKALATGPPARKGKWLLSLLATAAAILLLLLLLPGKEKRKPDPEPRRPGTTSFASLSTAIEAKKILLEIKLSRLREMANLSPAGKGHLAELDALQKELKTMRIPPPPGKREKKKENEESWIPQPKGECKNA